MINGEDWEKLQKRFPVGTTVEGVVKSHATFGIFVDIDGVDCEAIVEIIYFKKNGVMAVQGFPAVGDRVVAHIGGYQNSTRQIKLDMRDTWGANKQVV